MSEPVAGSLFPSRPLLPAIDRPSIEELTVLSEAEALRRRMDQRNRPVLRVLAALFTVYGLTLTLVAAFSRPWPAFVGGLAVLVLSAGFLLILLRIDPSRSNRAPRLQFLDPIARVVAPNFRAATLGYLTLLFLLLALPTSRAGQSWVFLFALVAVAFRLSVTEGAVLHAFYFLTAFLITIAKTPSGAMPPESAGQASETLVPALVLNLFAWAAGAAATWRFRRNFLSHWRDLRERTRDQVRMRDELEFARRVQLSMLPRGELTDGWIHVAGISVPATEVGGDYFDWFRLDGNRVAVVAGDVAGHGLASGLILSGLRSGLVLLAPELDRPAIVLEKLQRMVRETASHRMLVTLAVLLLDRESRRASVASAGHPPVLRRSAASGRVEQLPAASLPLGARLRQRAQEVSVPAEPGDVFVLYTDGVYEAVGPEGEPFGFDRLASAVESVPEGAAPREICDTILAAVRSWSGPGGPVDDATVVAVRMGGTDPLGG